MPPFQYFYEYITNTFSYHNDYKGLIIQHVAICETSHLLALCWTLCSASVKIHSTRSRVRGTRDIRLTEIYILVEIGTRFSHRTQASFVSFMSVVFISGHCNSVWCLPSFTFNPFNFPLEINGLVHLWRNGQNGPWRTGRSLRVKWSIKGRTHINGLVNKVTE